MTTEYLDANRANWNERATLHAARDGSGYGVLRYVEDRDALSDVVRFDQPLLGDLTGKRAVHLQCHIGTDTLSLARLGARVTGLDFSENAVAEARRLVAETGDAVDFVRSDVAHALDVLPTGAFDLVYTGIGALCWLPSITEWAGVVADLLAPGGTLHIREGHPVLWSMNETLPGLTLASRTSSSPHRWNGMTTAPTSKCRRRCSPPGRTSGTAASARSSPHCLTAAYDSTRSSSTTACRGKPFPAA